MTKEKNYITISVKPEVHKEFMLFKIKSNAKNLHEVMKEAIKLLKAKGFK